MASRKINFKFYYYVPWVHNVETDESTEFDFQRWLEKSSKLSYEDQIRINHGIKARLDICEVIPGSECWFFRFLRLREDNLPFMVKEDAKAEDFELNDGEYVAEGINTIYDAGRSQFMIQVNRNSLGISALQNYLTDIWNVEIEKIILKPVMKEIDLKKFRKGVYRRVEIGFANIPDEIDTRQTSFFQNIFQSFSAIRCKTATIVFGLGMSHRKGSLANGSVNALLHDIHDNTDVVRRAILKCSDDEDEKSEVINLLNCVEEDVISFTYPSRKSIAYEFLRDEMYRVYKTRASQVAAARNA